MTPPAIEHDPLPATFYARDATVVAPDLIGKLLCRDGVVGRINEVEAYREDEPASHSHRGKTERNAAMFGPGGVLYVYLSYGIHFCANVVTGPDGMGQAVLLRGVTIAAGDEVVAERRGRRPRPEWTNGPGKLCQAYAIDLRHVGERLTEPCGVYIADDGVPPPADVLVTERIGITKAVDLPWRWVTGAFDTAPRTAR